MMSRGNDGLGSEDFLPTLSNMDMLWLDESVLSVVGEDGRSRPWVDPLLSPGGSQGDEDDDTFEEEEDDDDLEDFDDFDDDDEEFFDDDEDLDDDEDSFDDEEEY